MPILLGVFDENVPINFFRILSNASTNEHDGEHVLGESYFFDIYFCRNLEQYHLFLHTFFRYLVLFRFHKMNISFVQPS